MSNSFPYKIDVLYEDADCVVVNKPAGLMVHPDERTESVFLTDWVISNYPDSKNVGENIKTSQGTTIERPGIVHRLDRDTSGVIVIAKTQDGHVWLKKQFQDRTVSKKYLAFVWGELKEEFGTITRPIGRSANEYPKWSAQRGARGEMRDAETYWTRLWTGAVEGDKFSLIQAEPKTGRTHQIRVHFQAVHHPVVCDPLYAENKPVALGFSRLALHARSIEFVNTQNKKVQVKAPLPEDFKTAYKNLGIRAQS